MAANLELIIVSGISGAGKSTALRALEDLGYNCIDNLPVDLLEACIDQLLASANQQTIYTALGLDARNSSGLAGFPEILKQLERRKIRYRTLFFSADNGVLIKRFNETRRKHPLSGTNITLEDAIAIEQDRLAPIVENSAIIDTTHLTPYDLRDLIAKIAEASPNAAGLRLLFHSFGYKYGAPVDADLVFDLRCLPNPYWVPELKNYTGKDPEIIHFLQDQPLVEQMFETIRVYLSTWIPHFESGNRSYLNVSLGCTGGRHRSVYMAERLGKHFLKEGHESLVRHRQI